METQLEQIQHMVVPEVIDEEYCLGLINGGNLLKGYGLSLAKNTLYEESTTGWESFCNRNNIVRRVADRQILFYEEKSGPMGPELPETERNFRALIGETIEDKAAQYAEVRRVTERTNPTALDIQAYNLVALQCVEDTELLEETQIAVGHLVAPTKGALIKSRKGMIDDFQHILDTINEFDAITQLTEVFQAETLEVPAPTQIADTCIEVRENLRIARRVMGRQTLAIERLTEQMHIADAERRLFTILTKISGILSGIKRETEKNKTIIRKMKPEFKNALQLLDILPTELMNMEDSILRKAYLKAAKKAHPDQGGSDEEFVVLKNAYDQIQLMLKKEEI